ncbi:hypothetical protein FQN50_001013 [Emmonsiellopsis sp. PD_5]|nr:hypothetical protein FQN50_001013 [Emmonsiellopsis sp. PD_5]
MPSKTQPDVNLWFLYICLQKSDYKTIDFNAVGEVTSLNPPAARMRFSRLKKAIENGTYTSTGGASSSASPESIGVSPIIGGKTTQKRKRRQSSKAKGVVKREETMQLAAYLPGDGTMMDIKMGNMPDSMVYGQVGAAARDGGGSAYDADYGDSDDDDVPLALKRRKATHRNRLDKKKRKQGHVGKSSATGVIGGYEAGDEDRTIGFLPHRDGKCPFPRYDTEMAGADIFKDEMMALDNYPPANLKQEMPYTNPVDITVPLPNTAGPFQSMFPEYTHATSNQLGPPLSSVYPMDTDSLYDANWGLWSAPSSQMIQPFDPSLIPTTNRNTSSSSYSTSYTRYPGMRTEKTPQNTWMQYRIPKIIITDTEPFAPRGGMAVDGPQLRVNQALFGPGSKAFIPRSAGRDEKAGKADGDGVGSDVDAEFEVVEVE